MGYVSSRLPGVKFVRDFQALARDGLIASLKAFGLEQSSEGEDDSSDGSSEGEYASSETRGSEDKVFTFLQTTVDKMISQMEEDDLSDDEGTQLTLADWFEK